MQPEKINTLLFKLDIYKLKVKKVVGEEVERDVTDFDATLEKYKDIPFDEKDMVADFKAWLSTQEWGNTSQDVKKLEDFLIAVEWDLNSKLNSDLTKLAWLEYSLRSAHFCTGDCATGLAIVVGQKERPKEEVEREKIFKNKQIKDMEQYYVKPLVSLLKPVEGKARKYREDAEKIKKEHSYKVAGDAFFLAGENFAIAGKWEEAAKDYAKAADCYYLLLIQNEARIYGVTFGTLFDSYVLAYKNAAGAFFKAGKEFLRQKKILEAVLVYENAGGIYKENDDMVDAKKAFGEAGAAYIILGGKDETGKAGDYFIKAALAYEKGGKLQEAEGSFLRAIKYYEENFQFSKIESAFTMVSKFFEKIGNREKAKEADMKSRVFDSLGKQYKVIGLEKELIIRIKNKMVTSDIFLGRKDLVKLLGDVVSSYFDIAQTWEKRGCSKEAIEAYNVAGDILVLLGGVNALKKAGIAYLQAGDLTRELYKNWKTREDFNELMKAGQLFWKNGDGKMEERLEEGEHGCSVEDIHEKLKL